MAKDDDVSIFDELDDKLDDFFAEDDDLFSEDDDMFSGNDDEFSEENDIKLDEKPASTSENIDLEEENSQVNINEEELVKESVSNDVTQVAKKKEVRVENGLEDPLHQLKAIVLEMDWEISDENLGKYLTEINRLIVNYQNDRPIYLFFKLHATIGEYMLKKKARAHPDALKFLYSVYNSLENALKDGVALVEKNKMILDEVHNFKSLKRKLFPGFYSEKSEDKIITESGGTSEHSLEENKSFDISSLPDDVQNGINEYIESMIAKKIEAMNKNS